MEKIDTYEAPVSHLIIAPLFWPPKCLLSPVSALSILDFYGKNAFNNSLAFMFVCRNASNTVYAFLFVRCVRTLCSLICPSVCGERFGGTQPRGGTGECFAPIPFSLCDSNVFVAAIFKPSS
jgi:hypothetical protein